MTQKEFEEMKKVMKLWDKLSFEQKEILFTGLCDDMDHCEYIQRKVIK